MSAAEIFEKYLNFLWAIFQFDMNMYTKWWMWAFLAIPAIGYTIFFFAKWAVMTAPLWLPFFLAFKGFSSTIRSGFRSRED